MNRVSLIPDSGVAHGEKVRMPKSGGRRVAAFSSELQYRQEPCGEVKRDPLLNLLCFHCPTCSYGLILRDLHRFFR